MDIIAGERPRGDALDHEYAFELMGPRAKAAQLAHACVGELDGQLAHGDRESRRSLAAYAIAPRLGG
ncbi:MAG TPA: hypothetical protein VND80_09875 [Steroidobacteraceae bacterium]|nr:hypothetical protein [Steroidobacteraceae bacterium]